MYLENKLQQKKLQQRNLEVKILQIWYLKLHKQQAKYHYCF